MILCRSVKVVDHRWHRGHEPTSPPISANTVAMLLNERYGWNSHSAQYYCQIAQWVELTIVNRPVAGSSPALAEF